MYRFRELTKGGSKNERTPLKHCADNMWIVKPAALNQGRGIEVFRNLFNYNSQVQIGKSASVYRAMSSATALGVNHCPLLRHVLTAGNSVVEHNIQSIYEFFHDGDMDALYDAWHETKTIKYYEELCG